MNRIKITLKGMGGELDCRVIEPTSEYDDVEAAIREAVQDIALNCIFSIGDTITIEEI